MNKIINTTLSGSDWNEIPIPAGMTIHSVAVQYRASADLQFNFRGGDESSVYWTIKSGTVLSLSWQTVHQSTRLFVKGTSGQVVETMIATTQ
jgi:hypothetical protein